MVINMIIDFLKLVMCMNREMTHVNVNSMLKKKRKMIIK